MASKLVLVFVVMSALIFTSSTARNLQVVVPPGFGVDVGLGNGGVGITLGGGSSQGNGGGFGVSLGGGSSQGNGGGFGVSLGGGGSLGNVGFGVGIGGGNQGIGEIP
ncbi:merozoite surface antigen 2, allelic form 2-like [Salvia divinorum]|uniref:Merozoite surface antigen 2, allelic form 2-like n=1 Tax=Salvia divinorum TaxID=28513 RepID=A0ABD1G110_SALDI